MMRRRDQRRSTSALLDDVDDKVALEVPLADFREARHHLLRLGVDVRQHELQHQVGQILGDHELGDDIWRRAPRTEIDIYPARFSATTNSATSSRVRNSIAANHILAYSA